MEDFAPVFHDGIGRSCSGGAWPVALLSIGRYGVSILYFVASSRVLLGSLVAPGLCARWQLRKQMCGANHLLAVDLLGSSPGTGGVEGLCVPVVCCIFEKARWLPSITCNPFPCAYP